MQLPITWAGAGVRAVETQHGERVSLLIAKDETIRTWPRIADYLDMDERNLRRAEQRDVDPLPVRNWHGSAVICGVKSELDAWKAREIERRDGRRRSRPVLRAA